MKTKSMMLAFILLSACHKKVEDKALKSEAPVATVQSVKVTTQEMPRYLNLTGSLIANQESDLAANAAGQVLKVFVERGTVVQRGQVLAQLDLRAAELGRSEAQANLESVRQQQLLAKQECARAQGLFERGAMTQQEFDRLNSQCVTALASANAALARARLADKAVGDAAIRAPFAGLIGERFVSVGEYVQPASKIVHLLELDPLRLELTVSEQDIGSIAQGQSVQFSVATFPSKSFEGVIRYVGPSVRAQTRDLVVEALVRNPGKALLPGMFATARVKVGMHALPMVPSAALRREETTDHLFVITEGGRLEERVVELGEAAGDAFSVLQGLQAGEQIVSPVTDRLVDGQRVKVTP